MAKSDSGGSRLTGRVVLEGVDVDEHPNLVVHLLDGDRRSIASVPVDNEGGFTLDAAELSRAHRVVIAAADQDPTDRDLSVMFRAASFAERLNAGDVVLPQRDWSKFFTVSHCISADIHRCFPFLHVVNELLDSAIVKAPIGHFRLPPFPRRCAPICEGIVEVYRRTCCCHRIIIDPGDVFDPPVIWPPVDFPIPWPPDPDPGPIVPPGPGPDPAPFQLLERVFTDGALDQRKLNAARDYQALKLLKGARLQEYLDLRPYLWCSCGTGTKVAQGFVGENGQIHVCWKESPRLHLAECHDEYAFVVKQNIGGNTITIYNGPAANQWFDENDAKHLTSYSIVAVTCRQDDFPVDPGTPFVVLQDIGDTESYHLQTPLPDSADSVQTPGTATGQGLLSLGGVDYALGGDLQLRYHFSESMKSVGARYYRVQRATANGSGDPVGSWDTLPVPAWKTWQTVGSVIHPGSKSLGPHLVNGVPDLFDIPFDTGAPLDPQEEWQDGQYHAVVPTASKPEGQYLFRIEVFDSAGVRLTPAANGFSFERWNTASTTVPVGFDALTHYFWADNRSVIGTIDDITGPGAGAGDCKFFVGFPFTQVSIQYRAFHPQPGTPSFLLNHELIVNRGISGTSVVDFTSAAEVGEGALPAQHDISLAALLGGEVKCSFSVRLFARARVHNGSGRLSGLDASDVAAFAAEQIALPIPIPLP